MLKLKLKGIGLGLVLMTSALVTSCSSNSDDSGQDKSSCATAKSKCANDRSPTADEISTCEKDLSDAKCGGVYAAALICLANHQICASDGTTDQDKTKAQCTSEIDTATACFNGDGGTRN